MEQTPFEGCFGCGPDNEFGLKATFRNMSDGGVEGFFTPQQHHCGYSDVVHVGPISGFSVKFWAGSPFIRTSITSPNP